jgi:hypothetical protein
LPNKKDNSVKLTLSNKKDNCVKLTLSSKKDNSVKLILSSKKEIWSFKTGGLSKEVYSTQLMKIGDILKWSVKKKRWYLNTGFTVLGTCNCASSLKQQSVGRHVAPLEHIILFLSQPVFALSPYAAYLAEKQQIPTL